MLNTIQAAHIYALQQNASPTPQMDSRDSGRLDSAWSASPHRMEVHFKRSLRFDMMIKAASGRAEMGQTHKYALNYDDATS